MAHRNIRLPDDLDQKIKKAADTGNVPYVEVLRICCEMMVDVVQTDFERRNEVFKEAKAAASEKIKAKRGPTK